MTTPYQRWHIKKGAAKGRKAAEAVLSDPSLAPFVHDYRKEAGVGDMFSSAGKTMATVALGTLAAGTTAMALQAVHDGYRSISEGRQKTQAFAEMVKVNPNLQSTDKTKLQRAFNHIWNFSPAVAKDPLMSGSQVQKILDYNSVILDDVKRMAEIERFRSEVRKSEIGGFEMNPGNLTFAMNTRGGGKSK